MVPEEQRRLNKLLWREWPHTRFKYQERPYRGEGKLTWYGRDPKPDEVRTKLDTAGLWGDRLVNQLQWAVSRDAGRDAGFS